MARDVLNIAVEGKDFGARRIIDRLSLDVAAGQVVSLVGPSGCGKSTLLRLVAGIDRDYRGRVLVQGTLAAAHRREVGFIFQEPRLLPWLTVAQNVGFDLGRKGASHPRVRELLDEVGLGDFADAYPKQLSGGMAQRAAIARGLFGHPDLLLLDEPFSAVDAFTRIRLQELLLRIARHHGATLLLVTHDVNEAVYLSDRVVVMSSRPGRIVGDVPVDLSRPRNRRHPSLVAQEAEVLRLLAGQDALAADADVEDGRLERTDFVRGVEQLRFAT